MGQFMDDFEYQGKQFKSNCTENEKLFKNLRIDKPRAVSVTYVSSGKIHDELEQGDTKKMLCLVVSNRCERKE